MRGKKVMPYERKGVAQPIVHRVKDNIPPTHVDKHMGQPKSFPKKFGLIFVQNSRQDWKMLPKTIIFVTP
jgi:hypothetical protein